MNFFNCSDLQVTTKPLACHQAQASYIYSNKREGELSVGMSWKPSEHRGGNALLSRKKIGSKMVLALRGNFYVALVFCGLFGSPVFASCLDQNIDSRLKTFCMVQSRAGKQISVSEALTVDALLKREGFQRGLGFQTKMPSSQPSLFIAPIVEYNSNINGGNPDRDLVLNGLTFKGDPSLVKKAGPVFGVGAGMQGRSIYGSGRYVDYSAAASVQRSFKYDLNIFSGSAAVCSKNFIKNQWYLDACADAAKQKREISESAARGISVSTAKLLSASGEKYHRLKFGLRLHDAMTYQHFQALFGWQVARSKGAYTSLNVMLGQKRDGFLVAREGIVAKYSTTVRGKPVLFSASYSFHDGKRLLAVPRTDTYRSLSIKYNLRDNIAIKLGYSESLSSIDYFNDSQVTFGIELKPKRIIP